MRALRSKYTQFFVPEIKDSGGILRVCLEAIADVFCTYYRNLYNISPGLPYEVPHWRVQLIQDYITSSGLPMLLDDTIRALVANICGGTKPGFAGHSFCKVPGSRWSPHRPYPYNIDDSLRTQVNIIPQERKDNTECQNYRPISLLNLDLKLFTRIW